MDRSVSGCAEHAGNPQPSWCLECMETTPPPPKQRPGPWRRTEGATAAVFTSRCQACSGSVREGERVRLWERDTPDGLEQVWLHDDSCEL